MAITGSKHDSMHFGERPRYTREQRDGLLKAVDAAVRELAAKHGFRIQAQKESQDIDGERVGEVSFEYRLLQIFPKESAE